jgi:hypothetical protein
MRKTDDRDHLLQEALRLLTTALEFLDEDGTVTAIGAQLDLARARLAEHLADKLGRD